MSDKKIMGIDLGGTNVRVGVLQNNTLQQVSSMRINATGSENEVIDDIYHIIDQSIDASVEAIGIGVPSVVDVERGIVYDVVNIPSWKEVHLKQILEERYERPVLVNNDANCFALGEKYFGKGQDAHSLVGLIIGTGMGAGVIIYDQLYAGPHCGAGEFGMVDYLDHNYEYYGSGQYFKNVHHAAGEEVFRRAESGDSSARNIFYDFGVHLGNAIKMILYTVDPELIILGGSVSNAFPYFEKTMWERISTFAFSKSLKDFRVEVSALANSGILGAAALHYDFQKNR